MEHNRRPYRSRSHSMIREIDFLRARLLIAMRTIQGIGRQCDVTLALQRVAKVRADAKAVRDALIAFRR